MVIQTGRFRINSMAEIDTAETVDGLKKVLFLDYMGRLEFEGNAIPISRMVIEYCRDDYIFLPMNVYNKNEEQLYVFINKQWLKIKTKKELFKILYSTIYNSPKFYTLREFIDDTNNCSTNFWWNLDADYMLFFGEEKKEIINYFIDSCFNRDGQKEGIKEKLLTVGYKF